MSKTWCPAGKSTLILRRQFRGEASEHIENNQPDKVWKRNRNWEPFWFFKLKKQNANGWLWKKGWFCVATFEVKRRSILNSNLIFASWHSRKLWTKKLILQPSTLYVVLCTPAAYEPGIKFDCGICKLHHESRSLWDCGGWWSFTMGKHRLLIRDASAGQVSNTGSELTWFLNGSQVKNQMGAT
jgi:hypothetical protein